MRSFSWLASAFLVVVTVAQVQGRTEAPREASPDEQKLLAAGLSADGPALVEFFRHRAQLDADPEALTTWTAPGRP